MKHIDNLDGIRAYAVIAVLLFHGVPPHFSYGWIGVQAFFILSGFLITSILLSTKTSDNYFSAFYGRRMLRIFPIYYVTLFLIFIYARTVKEPYYDIHHYIFYVQNFKLGYSNWLPNFPGLYNHTWSLAIEEQFYLFWPLVVKYLNEKRLAILLILLYLFAIFDRYYLSLVIPNNPLVWTNTIASFDMLALGGLLAVLPHFFSRRLIFWYLFLLNIFIVVIYFIFTRINHYDTFLTTSRVELYRPDGQFFLLLLVPVLGILIFYLAHAQNKMTELFFNNSIISHIGKISYGIYLYHYPVFLIIDKYLHIQSFALVNYEIMGFNISKLVIVFLKFSITFLLSVISWNIFEKRILTLKKRFTYHDPKELVAK